MIEPKIGQNIIKNSFVQVEMPFRGKGQTGISKNRQDSTIYDLKKTNKLRHDQWLLLQLLLAVLGLFPSMTFPGIQIEGFLLELQQFLKQFYRNMAYYFFINAPIAPVHAAEQWQGYYSSLPSLYQSADDLNNSSLYTITWHQNEFAKPNEHALALLNTAVTQDAQNGNLFKVVGGDRTKKRGQKTLEKEVLSAKKNSQSNIINQFYSLFGSRQKSQKIVQGCCRLMAKDPKDLQKILSLFYMSIRLINAKRGRKYVNAAMFLKFFSPEELSCYLPEMLERLEGSGVLSLHELCQIFRRCAKHFLKNVSASAILTSKRISIVSKEEHLKKRRKFLRTIMEL